MRIRLEDIKFFNVRGEEITVGDKDFLIANNIHLYGSVRLDGIGAKLYNEKEVEVTSEQLDEIKHIIANSEIIHFAKSTILKYLNSLTEDQN